MEPEGCYPLSQGREKSSRLAVFAQVVSELTPAVPTEKNSANDDPKQENSRERICDVLRRRGRGVARLSDTHTSAAPSSVYELPSSMVSMGYDSQLRSLASRKRQRIVYTSSGEEQQTSPTNSGEEQQTSPTNMDPGVQRQPRLTQETHPHDESLRAEIANESQQSDQSVRFREYQAEIWSEKFEELCIFRSSRGNCHVPHRYGQNMGLAQWVKRQRYQYKLKIDGKRSTLSDERIRLLNQIGFIWNSHDAVWEERLQELLQYKRIHGNCTVPSNYEGNPQLAVWTKRQRRQYKKYRDGTTSSMTPERIAKLENIGFVWGCRKVNNANYTEGYVTGVTVSASASVASIFVPKGIQYGNKRDTTAIINTVTNQTDSGNTNVGINPSPTLEASSNMFSKIKGIRGSSGFEKSRSEKSDHGPTTRAAHGNSHSPAGMPSGAGSVLLPGSSTGGRNSKMGLPPGSRPVTSPHMCITPVPSFSSIGSDSSNVQVEMQPPGKTAAKLKEEKVSVRLSDSPSDMLLTGKQQQKKKDNTGSPMTPKCDFYSFSHRYLPEQKKKPP